jgi:hypothetical protein
MNFKKILKIVAWVYLGIVAVLVFTGHPGRAADLVYTTWTVLRDGTLAIIRFLSALANR